VSIQLVCCSLLAVANLFLFASPAWVRERLTEIASHEKTHVDFLTTALKAAGATPVQPCTYDFGVTSPQTFVATAQILEGVGKLDIASSKSAYMCN
jgi:hypothetical protein